MDLINWFFRPSSDSFVIVFIDDILVYSKNEADHICHFRTVLQRLREKRLHARIVKCDFSLESVASLSYIVIKEGTMFIRLKLQKFMIG